MSLTSACIQVLNLPLAWCAGGQVSIATWKGEAVAGAGEGEVRAFRESPSSSKG